MYTPVFLAVTILNNFKWDEYEKMTGRHKTRLASGGVSNTIFDMCNDIIYHPIGACTTNRNFRLRKNHKTYEFSYHSVNGDTIKLTIDRNNFTQIKSEVVTATPSNEKSATDILAEYNQSAHLSPEIKFHLGKQHEALTFEKELKTAQELNAKATPERKTKAKKEKYIYRLRNIETKKYVSGGSKSKSTWQREYAVIDAIKSHCKHYGKKIEDFEICLFPVNEPKSVRADIYIKNYENAENEKKQKEIEKERAKERAIKTQRRFELEKQLLEKRAEMDELIKSIDALK